MQSHSTWFHIFFRSEKSSIKSELVSQTPKWSRHWKWFWCGSINHKTRSNVWKTIFFATKQNKKCIALQSRNQLHIAYENAAAQFIHATNYDKFYLYGFWFISKQQTGVIVLQRWMQLGYTMMHGSVLQSYAVVCTTMQTPASVSLCLFVYLLFVCLFDIMLSSSPIYRVYYFFITVYYCGIKLKGKEPLIS